MQIILSLTFEILNLVLAVTFLILFLVRMANIRQLSQTTRYLRTPLQLQQIYIPSIVASLWLCSFYAVSYK